ncbi:RusA family crossover junction endodeoxyribonuclease [uncultured Hymenobacter sp.]|uniref:RusA family crossover junction endodeoxyribonuclease n=1 Tax=uncultured Hymenobacter sp. TaxID=170016 RepID=UPI0035CA1B11
MKAILNKHPELDFFIYTLGGPEIPTKQDKFKLLKGYQAILEEGEQLTNLSEDFDLYIKQKGQSGSQQKFEEHFKETIKNMLTSEHPYSIDIKLEVVVAISMKERRLKEVDIDNLIKMVLDCFNGLVYTDDSQIINVLGTKEVNGLQPLNALMVGIRKVNSHENSWFKDIKLAYFTYKD